MVFFFQLRNLRSLRYYSIFGDLRFLVLFVFWIVSTRIFWPLSQDLNEKSLIFKIRYNNKSILGALAGWHFRGMGVAVSWCLAVFFSFGCCVFGHMGWNYLSFWLSHLNLLTQASANYVKFGSLITWREKVETGDNFRLWFLVVCRWGIDAKKWSLRF